MSKFIKLDFSKKSSENRLYKKRLCEGCSLWLPLIQFVEDNPKCQDCE